MFQLLFSIIAPFILTFGVIITGYISYKEKLDSAKKAEFKKEKPKIERRSKTLFQYLIVGAAVSEILSVYNGVSSYRSDQEKEKAKLEAKNFQDIVLSMGKTASLQTDSIKSLNTKILEKSTTLGSDLGKELSSTENLLNQSLVIIKSEQTNYNKQIELNKNDSLRRLNQDSSLLRITYEEIDRLVRESFNYIYMGKDTPNLRPLFLKLAQDLCTQLASQMPSSYLFAHPKLHVIWYNAYLDFKQLDRMITGSNRENFSLAEINQYFKAKHTLFLSAFSAEFQYSQPARGENGS